MRYRVWGIVPILLAIGLSTLSLLGSEQTPRRHRATNRGTRSSSPVDLSRSVRPTPAYYKSAKAAKPFPQLVPANHFQNFPVVAQAYRIANEMPGVMAQQPCYCNCDKSFGHRSLLDCYASDHTAGCAVCVKEAFFTYQLTHQGKSAGEIRKAIIRGDWQSVDLSRPLD